MATRRVDDIRGILSNYWFRSLSGNFWNELILSYIYTFCVSVIACDDNAVTRWNEREYSIPTGEYRSYLSLCGLLTYFCTELPLALSITRFVAHCKYEKFCYQVKVERFILMKIFQSNYHYRPSIDFYLISIFAAHTRTFKFRPFIESFRRRSRAAVLSELSVWSIDPNDQQTFSLESLFVRLELSDRENVLRPRRLDRHYVCEESDFRFHVRRCLRYSAARCRNSWSVGV